MAFTTVPVWFLLNWNWFLGWFSVIWCLSGFVLGIHGRCRKWRSYKSHPRRRYSSVQIHYFMTTQCKYDTLSQKVTYFYEKYIKKKFAKQIRSLLGYLLELYRSCALRHDMFAQNSEVLGIFPTNVKGDSTLANLNFFLALYWHISTGQNQDTSTSVPKMTPKSFKIASFSLYQALKSPQKFRQLWVAAPLTFWVPYVL